jgi:hypothetical protein
MMITSAVIQAVSRSDFGIYIIANNAIGDISIATATFPNATEAHNRQGHNHCYLI